MLENLIELFKQARIKQNMTQAELAAKIGLTDKAWSKIETGVNQLEIQHIGPLCKALNLTDIEQELFDILVPNYVNIAKSLQPETFIMFLLAFHTDINVENPTSLFKARAMNGDFNPLKEDEDLEYLPPHREPMDDETFAEAKADVTQKARWWNQCPNQTLKEIFETAINEKFERLSV